MPDHVHLPVEGTTTGLRLERFASSFKQTLTVVRYILENPVRKGLVTRFSDYPLSGSDQYSLEELAASCSQG